MKRLLIVLSILSVWSLHGQVTNPVSPTGVAGGDLSGTYPNPKTAKINGTSVPTNAAANQVALTTANAVTTWTSIPSCLDSLGQHLNYDSAAHTFSCGTTASVAGTVTSVSGTANQILSTGGATPVLSMPSTIRVNLKGAVTDGGGQLYNVKFYGATGDGTTDDTAAMAAAASAADAAGGGTLYFPQGFYRGLLTLPDTGNCVNIQGEGQVFTSIRANAVSTAVVSKGDVTRPLHCSISDITIDGNLQATNGLLLQNGKGWTIQRVQIRKVLATSGVGMLLGEVGAVAPIFYEARINNVTCFANNTDYATPGVRPANCISLLAGATDNLLFQVIAVDFKIPILDVSSGSNFVTDGHFYGTPIDTYSPTYGIETNGNIFIKGTNFDGFATGGIHAKGNFVSVTNSKFSQPSGSAITTAFPVMADNAVDYLSFGSNQVTNLGAMTIGGLITPVSWNATATVPVNSAVGQYTGYAGPQMLTLPKSATGFSAPSFNSTTGASRPLATAEESPYNNSIISSSVDASGNPNFLGTAANTTLPINGGSTSLVMYIAGVLQVLNTNVTLNLPATASVQQWILATQDTTNANLVAGDFLAMNTAPAYAYTAPTCPSPTPALSGTNPAFWFDLSTGLSKVCTVNAGSYTASPSIVVGVVDVNATPLIDFTLAEPFRLSPFRRLELFGTASDGTLTVTSGTTTIDVFKQYASVAVTGGTLTGTAYQASTTTVTGVSFTSQNPVLIVGGLVTEKARGRSTSAVGTGSGSAGNLGGFGGSAGGGGGSGTTSASGGAGGNHYGPMTFGTNAQGGTAGAATPTAGGAGTASVAMYPMLNYVNSCTGASGGNGAGDGTNAGGLGGIGGGVVFIKAPSILIASGISVLADGNAGANGAAGNAGGGGGGAGGCVILNAGFISSTGATITAAGGSAGSGVGTGQSGGAGAAGIAQQNRLW